ncbi:hypothetical protein GPL17_16590 [Bradyrhizobium yuanmingense]|uniref:hypothetical protein n=1 Tax=Bradyrhizobium yuanmingense TaxID=108015 RepID=UPI0012F95908|nr:hypothetical protein [Bradyrhizobium yuanmingense]MDA9546502.1 hypothetical protein [Bradyrhizobium sp. CCBAU 45321]MVT52102.1 hypothetical protein [Bradyrhizobium yuanmingense]
MVNFAHGFEERFGVLLAKEISNPRRRTSMAQRGRILTSRSSDLKQIARELVRLLDALEELDALREKVRLAEAARVLH